LFTVLEKRHEPAGEVTEHDVHWIADPQGRFAVRHQPKAFVRVDSTIVYGA